jgi:hypothetical protein
MATPLLYMSLQVVCPGDTVLQLPETGIVRIGGGVQQDGERLIAVKAGVLQQSKNGQTLWVQGRQRRCARVPRPAVPLCHLPPWAWASDTHGLATPVQLPREQHAHGRVYCAERPRMPSSSAPSGGQTSCQLA